MTGIITANKMRSPGSVRYVLYQGLPVVLVFLNSAKNQFPIKAAATRTQMAFKSMIAFDIEIIHSIKSFYEFEIVSIPFLILFAWAHNSKARL